MEKNFAEGQQVWDTNPPLDMCWRKGREHAAYGWSSNNPGGHLNAEQIAAFMDGYHGRPLVGAAP